MSEQPILETEAVRPTQERLAKGDAIITPERDRDHQVARPARVEAQTILDRYQRRNTLDEHQLAAGYKYQVHFFLSRRHGVKLMSWGGRVSGSTSDDRDKSVAAGISRDRALQFMELVGALEKSVVEWVCADDRSAEAWAVTNKMHPMRGIKTLRTALASLAKHYGITR